MAMRRKIGRSRLNFESNVEWISNRLSGTPLSRTLYKLRARSPQDYFTHHTSVAYLKATVIARELDDLSLNKDTKLNSSPLPTSSNFLDLVNNE
jgi:hypothetical protein